MFSDYEVNCILEKAKSSLKNNKIPKVYWENFLLELECYLYAYSIRENVCHKCLGTGLNTEIKQIK